MRFNAASEEEILEKQVWRSGTYAYEIRDANEIVSNAGNETIRLEIVVSDNSKTKVITDYLTGVGRGLVKLHQVCKALGILDKFARGLLSADDFPGHSGRLRLGVENGKKYAPRNTITDYLS